MEKMNLYVVDSGEFEIYTCIDMYNKQQGTLNVVLLMY
jgi:hypothetical protein